MFQPIVAYKNQYFLYPYRLSQPYCPGCKVTNTQTAHSQYVTALHSARENHTPIQQGAPPHVLLRTDRPDTEKAEHLTVQIYSKVADVKAPIQQEEPQEQTTPADGRGHQDNSQQTHHKASQKQSPHQPERPEAWVTARCQPQQGQGAAGALAGAAHPSAAPSPACRRPQLTWGGAWAAGGQPCVHARLLSPF